MKNGKAICPNSVTLKEKPLMDAFHQILITQIDRYGSTAFARVVSTNCPGVHVKHNRAVILLHSTAIEKTQGVAIVLVKGAITSNQLGVNIPNTMSV